MLDNWKQVYRAAGVNPTGLPLLRLLLRTVAGVLDRVRSGLYLGCRVHSGGGLSSLARLQAIRDNRAEVLLCTPTYWLRLAEVAAAEGVDLSQMAVRTIVVAGEPGGSVPAVPKPSKAAGRGRQSSISMA